MRSLKLQRDRAQAAPLRAGLGFLDRSISDKSHRSVGRIAARGDDDETTETKPFAAVQGQGGADGVTWRAYAGGTGRAV